MLLINELHCVTLTMAKSACMHLFDSSLLYALRVTLDVNRRRTKKKRSKMSIEADFPIKSLAKHFKILCYRIFIVHVTPDHSNTRFYLSFRLSLTLCWMIFNTSLCFTILILRCAIISVRSQQIIYYHL